jgi:hypothetical protein
MEEHLAVLIAHAERANDDDAYVWWGKVRSPNRQQPQKHLDEMRALDASLETRGDDGLQLYLTDYRSLWVADVFGIQEGDLPAKESAHVPAYYADEKLNCDFWFQIADARRLVADDLLAVIEELKLLRKVHYNERPVSLYGGMVDLPLFVTRPDGRRYFDEAERDQLTGGRLWAQFDAQEGSGTAAMERELRENVLGETTWAALEPSARIFIATGERLYRDHRHDPAFDFAPVLNSFAKALEVQVNALLRAALPKIPAPARLAKLESQTVDLSKHRPLSLGELARAIGGERELNVALTKVLGNWFTSSLPPILDELRELRNPGAHSARIDARTAGGWRDRLLGVGAMGVFVELARSRAK